jgi:hypothetical protein
VRGISIVYHSARVLVTTFCADICLDVDFQGGIVRFDAFQEQLTATKFAVRGWHRLNKVAHLLSPFYDQRRHQQGALNRVRDISDDAKGLTYERPGGNTSRMTGPYNDHMSRASWPA